MAPAHRLRKASRRTRVLLGAIVGAFFVFPSRIVSIARMLQHHAYPDQQASVVLREIIAGQQIGSANSARSGLLTIVSDATSARSALALVEQLKQWESEPPLLELYHNGTLSRFLQHEFEASAFVQVIDLSPQAATNKFTTNGVAYQDRETRLTELQLSAIAVSKLQNILLVEPSVILLRDPSYVLRNVEVVHGKGDCSACSGTTTACVMTTDGETADRLQSLSDAYAPNTFCAIRAAVASSRPAVISHLSSNSIARIHETSHGIGLWAHPSSTGMVWIRHLMDSPRESFGLGREDGRMTAMTSEYYSRINFALGSHVRAARVLALNRDVQWAAFDGGMEYSTMNSLSAAKESLRLGASVLTIDVVSTVDGQLFASHADNSFFPDGFGASNKLERRFSSVNGTTVQHMLHPCIPLTVLRTLDDNTYSNFSCIQDTVSPIESFLDLVEDYNIDLIVDLKATSTEGQLGQARSLVDIMKSRRRGHQSKTVLERRLSVRFFSKDDDDLVASIMPDDVLQRLSSDEELSDLHYYVNAPSAVACAQIANWIRSNTTILNKNIAGCFVVMNHSRMDADWERFQRIHDGVQTKHYYVSPLPTDHRVKMVCDVPRRDMNAQRLRSEYQACVIQGFDTIHHPFPVSSSRSTAMAIGERQSWGSDQAVPKRAINRIIQRELTQRMTDQIWREHESHWGYLLSPYDWSSRQELSFRGDTFLSPRERHGRDETGSFRCVTKVFVVMLILNLEERHLIDLQQRRLELSNSTLFETLTNTHLVDTPLPERIRFRYNNMRWERIPEIVEEATGLAFLDAMQYYVLDPLGVEAGGPSYFATNTSFPPYAARGFVGTLSDLLLVGSTLASHGVSPKTGRQVMSWESVARMLSVTNVSMGFVEDIVTRNMFRFRRDRTRRATLDTGVVEGYGMGLWKAGSTASNESSGIWQTARNGTDCPNCTSMHRPPLQGWLSIGGYSHALLYFEERTGLVVALLDPQSTGKYDLAPQFTAVVREVGDAVSQQWSEPPSH